MTQPTTESSSGWFDTPAPIEEHGFRLREIPRWSTLAAGLIASAGILHLVMLPSHLESARGTGLFFFVIGAGQIVWSCLFLMHPTPLLRRIGIVVLTAAPVGLWLLTRLFRSPWGTGPEAADFSSVGTVILQLAAGFVLTAATRRDSTPNVAPIAKRAVVLVAVGLLLGGVAYGGALAAEATIPWLGEPEVSHHEMTMAPEAGNPADPESQPHGHG